MKKLIGRLYRRFFLQKHKFPPTTYVHHRRGGVIFEIELNWYDEDLLPVSLVREAKSGKTFSIRHHEILEFVELRGAQPTDGIAID